MQVKGGEKISPFFLFAKKIIKYRGFVIVRKRNWKK